MGKNTEDGLRKQKDHLFKPGQSGNPHGRKPGTKNRSTLLAQALLDGQAEALANKVVQLALSGDTTCLRLAIERLVPVRREAPLNVTVPKVKNAGDIPKALEYITQSVTDGDVLPGEGERLAALIDLHRRALETSSIEERLSALEAKINDSFGKGGKP